MKQHKVDPYIGALIITTIGALSVFFILHTIQTLPIEALTGIPTTSNLL